MNTRNVKEKHIIGGIVEQQKSFKTIKILENPVSTGNKIGEMIEHFSSEGKMNKLKKFFKWLWYNKEQLLAILYNIVGCSFAQFLMWSSAVREIFPTFSDTGMLIFRIAIAAVSVGLALLTIRDVIVTYGLSDLETINVVLAERKANNEAKLSNEDKIAYKKCIATLNDTKAKIEEQLKVATDKFAEVETLFKVDSSLVENFDTKQNEYNLLKDSSEKEITALTEKITKISEILKNNVKVGE